MVTPDVVPTAIESVSTIHCKSIINWFLECIAPDVVVVGSQMTEDGWELLMEGPTTQLSEVVFVLGQGVE